MLHEPDYRIVRYKDDTFGLHEVYIEDQNVKGLISDPIIEGASPEKIINKLRRIIDEISKNIDNPLDVDSYQSDFEDFTE